MPRLPVDGKKCVEHRITFGTKERQLLQDLSTSYRIDAISGKDSIVEVFADSSKLIGVLGTLGFLLELFGITDAFDFDDELRAKAPEIRKKIKQKIKENAEANIREELDPVKILTSILTPGLTPFRIADFFVDTTIDTASDLVGGN